MPSDALVLGFDTSAAHCAAALVSGSHVLVAVQEQMERGQAERLLPLLHQVLAQRGVAWSDLSGLGVGVGPGNFTGIRIAVAAARGLSLGLDVPAIGVTVFDARAHGLPRPLSVVEDARRGMVYAQHFGADGTTQPVLCLPAQVDGDLPVTGTGAGLVLGAQVLAPAMPLAVAIAQVAASRLGQPHPRPAPLYLRAADAAPGSDTAPVMLA